MPLRASCLLPNFLLCPCFSSPANWVLVKTALSNGNESKNFSKPRMTMTNEVQKPTEISGVMTSFRGKRKPDSDCVSKKNHHQLDRVRTSKPSPYTCSDMIGTQEKCCHANLTPQT